MEQIEQEIERIRRDAGETFAEIEHRLDPRRAVKQGLDDFRRRYPAEDMRAVLADGAVPLMLIAAGLGLLAWNLSRRRYEGETIRRAESDEWFTAPTMDGYEDDIVLAEDSVREHHVHVADSQPGRRAAHDPSPERLLDIEHSHKSARGSAESFRR